MRPGQAKARHTLAEVALWELDRLDDLDRGDALDYTPDEARAAVAAWAWLLGAGTSGATFDAAREEVLQDGLTFAAMHRSVSDFLRLWRGFAWEDFDKGDDGWAWAVLDRARELARGLGPALAQQVSVVRAVARSTTDHCQVENERSGGDMTKRKQAKELPEFFQSETWLAWCRGEVDGIKLTGKAAGLQRGFGRSVHGAVKDAVKHSEIETMGAALVQLESKARAVVALGSALSPAAYPDAVRDLFDAAAAIHVAVCESLQENAERG